MAQDGRMLTGPDGTDGVVHASNVPAAEQAAWDVAVRLGLPVTRAELRTLLRAAEFAAGNTRMPGSGPAEGELRRWERILARHGVPGVTVLDVIEHGDGLHAELSVVWMPRSTFLQVMNASGRIPEDDPQYRPGLTGSLARIHHGLMTGEQ